MRQCLLVINFGLLILAPSAASSAAPATKLNAYLCDTKANAIDFAIAQATGTDEIARDAVNKKAGREACNLYVGFATAEEQTVEPLAGIMIRTTRYRMHFSDNRHDLYAWLAEKSFAIEPPVQPHKT
jgi:hypothetical protein